MDWESRAKTSLNKNKLLRGNRIIKMTQRNGMEYRSARRKGVLD
jgi:hypothetical protein